jgi:hypothetical protein
MRKLLFLLLLIPAISFAQGTATQIRHGASLPGTCSPTNGDVFFKTGSSPGLYDCPTTNTWRLIATASSGSPGGSTTDVQINDAGAFYGDSQFTYDKTTHVVSIGNGSTRGTVTLLGAAGAASAPAASSSCTAYYNTTTGKMGWINTASGDCGPATSGGTVTHTGGALTSGSLMVGAGTDDSAVLASDPTNCSTGNAPTGIDKTGAAKGCASISGGSAALVLVEQHTASTSASLSFTSCISSTYDEYALEFVGLTFGTNAVIFEMRMSTNGGSSYDSGTNYSFGGFRYTDGGSANSQATGQTNINITNSTDTIANTSNWSLNGSARLFNPGSAALYKFFEGKFAYFNASSSRTSIETRGVYEVTTAVNAFQFFPSSGTFSGTIRCFGIAK